jgi:hypothetical protein
LKYKEDDGKYYTQSFTKTEEPKATALRKIYVLNGGSFLLLALSLLI